MEYGLEAGIDGVADREAALILDAGRRQSRASYGQFREMVVVNGMKKESNGTKGLVAIRLSRRRGLVVVSGLYESDFVTAPTSKTTTTFQWQRILNPSVQLPVVHTTGFD